MSFLTRLCGWVAKRPDRALDAFLRRWTIAGDAQTTRLVLDVMAPLRAVAPRIVEMPAVSSITVIAPHPDDELMGAGGTLLRCLSAGTSVTVVYLTDGEPDAGKAAMRRAEAEKVASALGHSAAFLGFPIGPRMRSGDAARRLAAAIDASVPDILLMPFVLDDNDDHRIANGLLLDACRTGGLRWSGEVWAYQVYSAVPGNVLVPLGEFAARKAAAIRRYESQRQVRDWATFALGLNAVAARFTPRACRDTHVEPFLVLPLPAYLDIVARWTETMPYPTT